MSLFSGGIGDGIIYDSGYYLPGIIRRIFDSWWICGYIRLKVGAKSVHAGTAMYGMIGPGEMRLC